MLRGKFATVFGWRIHVGAKANGKVKVQVEIKLGYFTPEKNVQMDKLYSG